MNENSPAEKPQATQAEKPAAWVTKKDLANRYGVAVRTVNAWMTKGIIPYVKPTARMVRFHIERVDEALLQQFEFNRRFQR